jgi:hypothetical protein
MRTAILALLVALVAGNVHAKPNPLRYWGRPATGTDIRRSELHSAYCRSALERALLPAGKCRWIDDPR